MNKIKIVLAGLFLALFFSGCQDEAPQIIDISEVTISNIPRTIPIVDSEDPARDTFRVYLNASNSQSPLVAPEAKGLAVVSEATLQSDGTHTVTIQLQNPNPGFGEDGHNPNPNLDTGSWSGTARYFSVMISPDNTTPHGVNAIWVQVAHTLNAGRRYIEWGTSPFMNSRNPALAETLGLGPRIEALYNDVLSSDPYVTTTP